MLDADDCKSEGSTDINSIYTGNASRRNLLKAFAGIPVLGLFSWEVSKYFTYTNLKKGISFKDLGLENLQAPVLLKNNLGDKKDVLRVGIIGFGSRAQQLANGLGYMHPSDTESKTTDGTLANWLEQEDLNIDLAGICDVFDNHAEIGMAYTRNEIRPGGGKSKMSQAKRYLQYQDMLADKNIDAVVIATPDHHHARITIDAIKAGKHVYCEKSIARTEAELYEVYNTVKNSDRVYQLGHQITQNVIFQKAKEIIEKDILGKITLIETTTNRNSASGAWIRHLDAHGNPKPGDEKTIDWKQWLGSCPYVPFSIDRFYNWTKWFDYDIGMIGQLFTHEYDAVNQLLNIGIPDSVTASGGIYFWKDNREIPDLLHCVFEYPKRGLTLLYSASLASSCERGRKFMGRDASMELGESLIIKADNDSPKYSQLIKNGTIDPLVPMITIRPGPGKIDAVSSATAKYYASRGLTTTNINGKEVDVTHLHLREWVNCIRNGGKPSANIDRAFEEGITCLMAHKAYLEKRQVTWDPIKRKII